MPTGKARQSVTFERPESDPYLAIKYIGGGLLIVAACAGLYVLQSSWLTSEDIPQARREQVPVEQDLGEQLARDDDKDAVEEDRKAMAKEAARREAEETAKAEAEAAAEKLKRDEEIVRRSREEKAKKDEAEKTAKEARIRAFADLKGIPETIERDLPTPGRDPNLEPIDLGPFDYNNLVECSLTVAHPKVPLSEAHLLGVVEADKGAAEPTWRITCTEKGAEDDRRTLLATLENREGRLYLTPTKEYAINNSRFALFRRSVLVIKARDPMSGDTAPPQVRAIRLVRPKKGNLSREFDPTTEKATILEMQSKIPVAIAPPLDNNQQVLPAEKCNVCYELMCALEDPDGALKAVQTGILDDKDPRKVHELSLLKRGALVAVLEVTLSRGSIKVRPDVQGADKQRGFEEVRRMKSFDAPAAKANVENKWIAVRKSLSAGLASKTLERDLINCVNVLRGVLGLEEEAKEIQDAINTVKNSATPEAQKQAKEELEKRLADVERRAKDEIPEIAIRKQALAKWKVRVTEVVVDAFDGDIAYPVQLFVAEEGESVSEDDDGGDESSPGVSLE
jgi:hypothetical protein